MFLRNASPLRQCIVATVLVVSLGRSFVVRNVSSVHSPTPASMASRNAILSTSNMLGILVLSAESCGSSNRGARRR